MKKLEFYNYIILTKIGKTTKFQQNQEEGN